MITACERSGRSVGFEEGIVLQTDQLGADNGWEADNIVDKGNELSDFRGKRVRLSGTDDLDVRLVDGAEGSELSLKHFLGNLHGKVNENSILHV